MAKRTRKGSRRKFHLTIERDADGNYVGSVAELKGCHTQARSLVTLFARIKEVIDLCLEGADGPMSRSKDVPIPGFKWIATNPGKFGGKPIVSGTRFTVSFILGCLGEEMTAERR